MTILEALQEATEKAGIPTFSFANLREFNAFMESFRFDQYPVNVVVPYTENGQWVNGRRKSVIPLQGWVLKPTPYDGIEDIRTAGAHKEYIEPMKKKAIAFIKHLLNTEIIDPEVVTPTDVISPEYAFLSQHVFGVSYTINLPIVKGVC